MSPRFRLIRSGDFVASRATHEATELASLLEVDAAAALCAFGRDGNDLMIFGRQTNESRGGPDYIAALYADSRYAHIYVFRRGWAKLFAERFRRRRAAAARIQRAWRRCACDPSYAVCKARLLREWEGLVCRVDV